MTTHLRNEIENLKKKLLSISILVEESLRDAVVSITKRDKALAAEVIKKDEDIDEMEVYIEEECLKILALYQPVAIDLRFIVAILKINNDLERIGDLAVNIAERGLFLAGQSKLSVLFDFPGMAEKVQIMLRKSLDSLVTLDAALAREVCAADDEVDEMNHQMYDQVKDGIRSQPEGIDSLIHILGVSRHLERIADLATNIAEDVIYMEEGKIVRHRTEEFNS